jgi:hypothetical protein
MNCTIRVADSVREAIASLTLPGPLVTQIYARLQTELAADPQSHLKPGHEATRFPGTGQYSFTTSHEDEQHIFVFRVRHDQDQNTLFVDSFGHQSRRMVR